jgi:FMN phosphatase YigB (HAD superfamily)
MANTTSTAPVKHLLVDLDGTLLGNRHHYLSYDFVRQALSSLKVYGGLAQATKLLISIGRELKKTSENLTNDIRIVELFSKQMNVSIEEARRILRESVMTIFPTLEKHFYPIQGAKDFLDWASPRFPLTLATNPIWPPEIIELRVRWAGIDPTIFSDITHVRRMHAYKPSPQYYEEILSQNKLKASDCLLIGDNMKMDLPATRVGIRVFIVGPYKTLTPIQIPKAKAQAWKGNYEALRKLLESLSKNITK